LPRNRSATLTEAELRLMNVFWQKGPATVHEVMKALPEKPSLAYNSVLTTIRVLEKKGFVKHIKDGRAHVYTARVNQQDATRFEIRHLVSRFFRDSHELLVLNILDDKQIDADELARLRNLLEGSK
jgi:BlaI family transcriptional regulator, penicillinase repressor